jgi:hypothetical protein
MIWGTFLGGSEEDEILGLATNAANSLFVTGYTKSSASAAYTVGTDFPIVAGSGDTYAKQAGQDAFISKFDDNGVLEWSTVFGGNGNDFSLHNIAAGRGSKWGDGYTHKVIGINSVSEVYITGGTSSTNFLNMPSASGDFNRSASAGGVDAFITKFSRDGNLIWSTYFGGNLGDYINAISIDPNDNVYIGGYTSSTNLPTRLINPTYYQIFNPSYSGMTDGFLQIFDNTGNHIWGGYFGGHENDYLCTMAYSSSDEQFYIGGFTKSGTTTMTGKRFPVKAGKHINSYNQLTKSSTNFDGFIGAFSFQPIIELPDARFGRSAEIIEKGDQAFSIKVYPNPSDGLINISFGKAITQTTLEVYNLMGQRIVNKALNDLKADEEIGIDLKSFPKGVYFLRTNGPEGALTGRVMINN